MSNMLPRKFRLPIGAALAAWVIGAPGGAGAQALQPGHVAPPEVLETARRQPGVEVSPGFRLLPAPGTGLPASRSTADEPPFTLILSDPGGRVGISHHEISVTGADTGQVEGLTRQLNPRAVVHTFPGLSLTMIRVPTFSELAPLVEHLTQALPDAGINVPVTWNLVKPR